MRLSILKDINAIGDCLSAVDGMSASVFSNSIFQSIVSKFILEKVLRETIVLNERLYDIVHATVTVLAVPDGNIVLSDFVAFGVLRKYYGKQNDQTDNRPGNI